MIRDLNLSMGVNGLLQHLRKLDESIVNKIPLDTFSGKTVAVDTSIFLYKYLCVSFQSDEPMIMHFWRFVRGLQNNGLRPVFIFDGTPPDLKSSTHAARSEQRQKTKAKIAELEAFIADLESNVQIVPPTTPSFLNLSAGISRSNLLELSRDKLNKLNSQCISVKPSDVDNVKKLLDLMGIGWYTATGEAERTCSWLCVHKYVDAVLTTDSDVLVYGAPTFIKSVSGGDCEVVFYDVVLELLDLTPSQFRDFCIMCGVDYNKRIPKVGPVKSLKLLEKHTDLDGIAAEGIDTSNLLYPECRALFTLPDRELIDCAISGSMTFEVSIGDPKWSELREFMTECGVQEWIVKDIGINDEDEYKNRFNVVVVEDEPAGITGPAKLWDTSPGSPKSVKSAPESPKSDNDDNTSSIDEVTDQLATITIE